MPNLSQQIYGTLEIGGSGLANYPGVAFGTVILGIVYPWPGRTAGNFIQKVTPPNVQYGRGITHITKVIYTNGGTAHLVQIARPFNRTHLIKAIAANAGTTAGDFKPAVDAGKYSTSYNYPVPGGLPGLIADNVMAAGDYVVIQLDDGSWFITTIAAGTFLGATFMSLTTALPNFGVGASIGNAVYWYGNITTDKNPATGLINPGSTYTSATRDGGWVSDAAGIVSAFNPGDPLVLYSPNGTATGNFDAVSGYYSQL